MLHYLNKKLRAGYLTRVVLSSHVMTYVHVHACYDCYGLFVCSRNQLSYLPSFICRLHALEVLLASNNRLVSLPEEIGELQNLMDIVSTCTEVATSTDRKTGFSNRHLRSRCNTPHVKPYIGSYL